MLCNDSRGIVPDLRLCSILTSRFIHLFIINVSSFFHFQTLKLQPLSQPLVHSSVQGLVPRTMRLLLVEAFENSFHSAFSLFLYVPKLFTMLLVVMSSSVSLTFKCCFVFDLVRNISLYSE